jgi:HEPN domain-containing protein
MSPEMELVLQWMQRAVADLRGAEHALSADPPLTEDSCFHSQQAVEKALKAFLVYRDADFEWSHRIRYLLNLCVQYDPSFEQWCEQAGPLTEYAVRFRYPHIDPPPTVQQSLAALEVARRVYHFVLDRLPPEAHPTP